MNKIEIDKIELINYNDMEYINSDYFRSSLNLPQLSSLFSGRLKGKN